MRSIATALILATGFLTLSVMSTTSSEAASFQSNGGYVQILKRGPQKYSTPGGGGVKIKCNGKTASQCCTGLSYCTCLYMPGLSSDDHPTSCHKGKPPQRK
jgi:hypothetical protein